MESDIQDGLFPSWVVGVDEVGRGALAGPVVASAVLCINGIAPLALQSLAVRDSKSIKPAERQHIFRALNIRHRWHDYGLWWSVGMAPVGEIDAINIRQASLLAMRRAVQGVFRTCPIWCQQQGNTDNTRQPVPMVSDTSHSMVLQVRVDGLDTVPDLLPPAGVEILQQAIVGGDSRQWSIAAASIIAKVRRDGLMQRLDKKYTGYGLAQHKGYGTAMHRQALRQKGASPCHRERFIRKIMEEG